MARTMHEKRPEEDNRYHDTWKLLKKYRDVTWSLEVSVRQVKNQFRIDISLLNHSSFKGQKLL